MGGCQNYGPFLDPYYNTAPKNLGYPKRDHNLDNHPYKDASGKGVYQGCMVSTMDGLFDIGFAGRLGTEGVDFKASRCLDWGLVFEGLRLRVLGFRVLGFRVLGSRV